ncbi:MAG: PAS domain S-box protein [Anaerolineae bacterium]|nr:PAS domain S-box protein [Anaerolineae bacterium]
MWPYTTHTIIFMSLTTAVSALVAFWVWQRRRVPNVGYLAVSTVAVTFWSLGYLIELTRTEVAGLAFWNRVQYLFIQVTMVAWLAFVVQYTGNGRWLTLRWLVVVSVIPALTVALAWTNDSHHLVWQDIQLNMAGVVPNTLSVRGPWYWVAVAYSYLLLVLATFLLVRAFVRAPELYRRQAGTLLIGVLAPWLANVLHIVELEPIAGLELTPFAFTVTNITFAWNLFRNRLLDIVPVARAAIIERMRDAVIVLDAQNRVVDLNPAAQILLGHTDSVSIGKHIDELLKDWPELSRYCRLGEDVQAEISCARDQDRRTFDLRLYSLGEQRRQLTGILIVLRDITERARAAEQRELLIQELDAFAHTVAHDLKNPLTLIIAYGDLVASRYDKLEPERIARYLDGIVQTGYKMNNIIAELLLLASVRNQDEIEICPLGMQDIVTSARQRLSTLIEQSGAEVVAPEVWPIALGHAAWVEEVWANYLSNAIKYGGAPDQDVPPRIELGATILDGQIRFWVRDNGGGIPSEKQDVLFTRFTRLDQVRAEGHGLGLSIVRRIVTRLGGQVGVESQEGQGSTFYFTLPAAKDR